MDKEIKTPKVTLLTGTMNPMATVYSVWQASKSTDALMTPDDVWAKMRIDDPEDPNDPGKLFTAEVRQLFRAVIAQRIPIGEHVDFVFMLENISISWREQAVRHRIGTLASPERVGADLVMMDVLPNLADSSWWSQSMRIQDMSQFADNGEYRVPETVINHQDPNILRSYHVMMNQIQRYYSNLVSMGIPMEDARELIPLGAQHRMSWKLNIGSLQHIVSKRGCWILQLGIWGPIITGMIKELSEKVDPIFGELVTPPCIKGDEFTGCVYHEECRRRYTGDDKLPPCPLHFKNHHIPEQMGKSEDIASAHTPETQAKFKLPLAAEMRTRVEDYRTFWARDPYTGKRNSPE